MSQSPWNSVIECLDAWRDTLARAGAELDAARKDLERAGDVRNMADSQEQLVRSELHRMALDEMLFELEQELSETRPSVEDPEASVLANLGQLDEALERRLSHTSQEIQSLVALARQSLERVLRRQKLLTETMTLVTARKQEVESAAADEDPEETVAFEAEPVPEPEGAERRRFSRGAVPVEVRLTGSDVSLHGTSENVSAGGLFFATEHPVELGTMLHVRCELPQGREARADGVAIWRRAGRPDSRAGIGVEFLAISADDQQRLEDLFQNV